MWGNVRHFIAHTLSLGLPVPDRLMMFLIELFGFPLLAPRALLELSLCSQCDTSIFLFGRCTVFRIFSRTGIPGMDFDLSQTLNVGVCRYKPFHSE